MPINIIDQMGKYLGLPSHICRSKRNDFKYLLDRIWNKIYGLNNNDHSYVGKVILIKVAAQVIRTYAMNVFKFLENLYNET